MSRLLRRVAVFALILVPAIERGPAPLAQSRNLTPSAEFGVEGFQVDPNGRFVVYVQDGRVFSRRLDRAASAILLSGSSVGTPFSPAAFEISPDGTRVVYQEGGTVGRELFAVPIDGSAPSVRLSGPLAPGGFVSFFRIASDGASVVYVANEDNGPDTELRSVPIDGSAPSMELQGAVHPRLEFDVSPDGAHVVFQGFFDGTVSSEAQLFGVPIDGSTAPVHLNQSIANTRVLAFRFPPLGDRVVFWAEKTQFFTTTRRLYSVPFDGSGTADQISGATGNVWLWKDNTTSVPFDITPDGAWVISVADHDNANRFELWKAPIDGGAAPVKLNGPMVAGGDVSTGIPDSIPFRILPGGTAVVYAADQEVNGAIELYRAPIDASAAPLEISGSMVAGGSVQSFTLDPAGTRVAYLADQDTDGVFELHGAPADGTGPRVSLSGPFGSAGSVPWFSFDPGGAQLAYVADQDLATTFEIYRVQSAGLSAPRKLNPTPVSGGDVLTFPSPLTFRGAGGPAVLYVGDLTSDLTEDLYLGFLAKPVLPVPPLSD